jgi:hypothetical protein
MLWSGLKGHPRSTLPKVAADRCAAPEPAASSDQRLFGGGALGPDVSAHLPNGREWRAYRARLISAIDHAAVEFRRRSKGRTTGRDNSRELFQLVFGPCSIAHDINSSPSAFSARAVAVLARRNLFLFALSQIIPTPVFWFLSGS